MGSLSMSLGELGITAWMLGAISTLTMWTEHSGPDSDWEHRHAGDLGNIIADVYGDAYVDIQDMVITLGDGGSRDVNTRTIVVHADEDDLGLGTGDLEAESKLTGNAGERLSCGVIQTLKF